MSFKDVYRIVICMLISIVLSVVFIYVFGQTNIFLSILNNLFIIASILLIIGGGFFVLQGGFFNGITYSFKRFFSRITRLGEYATAIDGDVEYTSVFSSDYTYPILIAGGIQFILVLIISVVYF
ncbi:DUF3899 domain-containing protein [Viridibacillus arvi]|uniref:DUF3899 domain-containing protein n=1 Tax=Viridibacillus arvi TaxID=263475 RepID=UPI0036EC8DDE